MKKKIIFKYFLLPTYFLHRFLYYFLAGSLVISIRIHIGSQWPTFNELFVDVACNTVFRGSNRSRLPRPTVPHPTPNPFFGTATPAGPLLALSVLSCSLSIWSVPLILVLGHSSSSPIPSPRPIIKKVHCIDIDMNPFLFSHSHQLYNVCCFRFIGGSSDTGMALISTTMLSLVTIIRPVVVEFLPPWKRQELTTGVKSPSFLMYPESSWSFQELVQVQWGKLARKFGQSARWVEVSPRKPPFRKDLQEMILDQVRGGGVIPDRLSRGEIPEPPPIPYPSLPNFGSWIFWASWWKSTTFLQPENYIHIGWYWVPERFATI